MVVPLAMESGEICTGQIILQPISLKETPIKSFDRLRTNGNLLIPFVVSLSNHFQIRFNRHFLKSDRLLDCSLDAR